MCHYALLQSILPVEPIWSASDFANGAIDIYHWSVVIAKAFKACMCRPDQGVAMFTI